MPRQQDPQPLGYRMTTPQRQTPWRARCRKLAAVMRELRAQAAAAAEQRSEAWLPVAAALASWLEQAKSSQRAEADLADVRKAIDWLRKAGQEIRDDRMAQLTKTSAEVWGLLRQKSNVELGPIKLAGASTQRHVSVDVAVDGVAGAALGVMSQGELHALGLALFLPAPRHRTARSDSS